jgi:hypothetical protein
MPLERSPRTDPALLHDMIGAAEAVGRFIAGKSRDDYGRDEMLRAAVERKVEIIGEAPGGLSDALRAARRRLPAPGRPPRRQHQQAQHRPTGRPVRAERSGEPCGRAAIVDVLRHAHVPTRQDTGRVVAGKHRGTGFTVTRASSPWVPVVRHVGRYSVRVY